MTELFVMGDGGQVDTQGAGDKQKLIEDGFGWRTVKRNKYKLLLAGLTVVVLVSCVAALVVTLSGDSNTNESSAAASEKKYPANQESLVRTDMSQGNGGKRGRKHHAKGNSNEGTQFAIAFSAVRRMELTSYFECVVSTKESSTVRFESSYLLLNKTVYLAAGVYYTESFPNSIKTSGDIEGKGIYIYADRSIVVQCAGADNFDYLMLDSFLALPYREEDKEYYIAVCGDQPYNSDLPVGFVIVVATADNTKVNITCPSGVPECPSEEYSKELDMYQTYSIYVYINSDLTGFYVSASKPVSVYAGSPNLVMSVEARHQYAVFSVPSRQTLGTLHYTPQTWGEPDLNHGLRIVATDTTTLSIPQYGVNQTLESKQHFTQDYLTSNGPVEVACSSPCLVIHCNRDSLPSQAPLQGFMTRITPIEAYTDDVVFSSIEYFNFEFEHYLSIVVNQYPVTDLYLDDISLSDNEWIPNEIGNYATVILSVSPALHRLNSSNTAVNFSGYCHGYRESALHSGYGSQVGVGGITYALPDSREAPGHRISVWGNFSSLSGDDFSIECGAGYAEELGQQADDMIPILNNLLGSELCEKLADDGLVVTLNSNQLTTSGPNGETWVSFTLKVDRELCFEEVHDCAAEVTTYLLDHDNWGSPLLPPIDGCPFPVFNPPRFYDDGTEWVCSDTLNEDESLADSPSNPGYDFTMESNFTTFSGEDLSTECGNKYTTELDDQTGTMFLELNSRLGSSLCEGTAFRVLTGNSIFYHQGSQGIVTVKYTLMVDDNGCVEDVFECTDDILPFVLDHNNWGIPLLPPQPGCPALVFHEQRFYEKGQKWNCDVM